MVRVKSIGIALALLASTLPTAASAQYWADRRDHGRPPAADYARAGYPPRGYEQRWADGPPPDYRGRPPHARARCDRGGGAIIGAIAGGLLGNAVAGRGDRGLGTILGAGAGALTGREIDRGC